MSDDRLARLEARVDQLERRNRELAPWPLIVAAVAGIFAAAFAVVRLFGA